MREQSNSDPVPDPLDELVSHLLSCDGALSQIISHMVRFGASGRSAPNAAPIPEAAHSLIRSVIAGMSSQHSKRDIRVAAKIVAQVTDAICEDIFAVDPEWFDELTGRDN
jgi:hypothetical protein